MGEPSVDELQELQNGDVDSGIGYGSSEPKQLPGHEDSQEMPGNEHSQPSEMASTMVHDTRIKVMKGLQEADHHTSLQAFNL